MLTALVRLRGALQERRLPLELPGVAERARPAAEMVDQLEDYVIPRLMTIDAPLLAVVGGSTGAGKSTLVNSLVGSRVTEPGVLRPTTRSPVLVHHPDDARVVRPGPAAARARAGRPRSTNDPEALQLVPSEPIPAGLAILDAPRHRLGRGAQPHARRPAARRRRPLALRHLRRALRRPGAVGLPAPGRRAVAPPSRSCSTAPRRRRSRPSPPTSPGCSPAAGSRTRRCSPSPRAASTRTGLLPAESVADIRAWLRVAGRGRRRPRGRGPADPGGRGPHPDPAHPRGRRRRRRAGRRRAPPARGRRRGLRPRRSPRSPRPPPTAPCCAARCWPAGRSSSAPASCSSRSRPGSAGSATGSSTPSRASRSRPSGSPWPSSPAWRR